MSSLAGALDDPETRRNQDIPMDPASDRDEDEEMDDLFGNDEDVENYGSNRRSQSPTTSQQDSERLASPERERRQALEYGEDDAQAADVAYEVTEAEVSFPNIPVPRSSDGDKWVIRTPNFVQVDSKPFHPDTYTGPEQEDEDFAAENVKERSMTIKLKVENTIRWRWTKDETGQERQQSNSRVIRWSDGSLSLRLGNELFDITKSIDTSAGQPRALGASQPSQSQPLSQGAAGKNQGLTYLVAQHKRSQVLQAEAVITGNMSLRPTSMQSETHRMLVKAVGQKHNKVARLKMTADPTVDPEREKMELAKQSNKKTRKRGDADDGMGGGGSRRRRFSKRTDWSDDEDEFGAAFSGGEDEDGSSPRKAKRKDEDEKGGYQEDDFLVADDSDEDAGTYKKKKRRRDDYDEDPLDKLDATIEANQKGGPAGDSDDDKPMDVESEEEDEDLPVRRTTGSSRRRAVNFDDDEE
ncbi:Leo1-like protein-domain-containing protein [Coprinopsis sp. MPI-PUGE-AT-0042]|nr:Leo1-like protein-domain-containing protein [Coprinopsis sp. MPI-PUGE-AT-0042]